jgi:hypothetical protein
VRICLQQYLQYVSNDANIKKIKQIILRIILPVTSLRRKFRSIHWCNFKYNYCYYSLVISKITLIHLWLVLQTSANIKRIAFAILFTGVSQCSTNVHR